MAQWSPEESPTRYMLPDNRDNWDIEDHLGQMIEPDITKKRKKKDKKKNTKKPKPGKYVAFKSKVILNTIYKTLKNQTEEIDLTNEEDYPSRITPFALKRKRQQDILKYQHQYRPLTPRRQIILKHIQDTLQREINLYLLLLLHRHYPRIRSRGLLRNPLQHQARKRRIATTLQESFTTGHTHSL